MIASAQASAASRNDSVTAGPEKLPAARAPTEKMPAPTATATPRIIRSQAVSDRLSSRPGSAAPAMVCSIDLVRNRLRSRLTLGTTGRCIRQLAGRREVLRGPKATDPGIGEGYACNGYWNNAPADTWFPRPAERGLHMPGTRIGRAGVECAPRPVPPPACVACLSANASPCHPTFAAGPCTRHDAEPDMLLETLTTSGHEQVVFCNNPDAGLKAIIAVHNTVLGPALGGVRMRPYVNEADAVRDVLRLSRTMTYKNALAGLNIGGGKAVILGDPKTDKSEVLFRAFGRAVDALGGRYITAEDVGTDVNDMELVYLETEYVTGVHQVHGGSGDPAPFTAYGTMQALMACLQRKLGHEEIGKTSIAVQ